MNNKKYNDLLNDKLIDLDYSKDIIKIRLDVIKETYNKIISGHFEKYQDLEKYIYDIYKYIDGPTQIEERGNKMLLALYSVLYDKELIKNNAELDEALSRVSDTLGYTIRETKEVIKKEWNTTFCNSNEDKEDDYRFDDNSLKVELAEEITESEYNRNLKIEINSLRRHIADFKLYFRLNLDSQNNLIDIVFGDILELETSDSKNKSIQTKLYNENKKKEKNLLCFQEKYNPKIDRILGDFPFYKGIIKTTKKWKEVNNYLNKLREEIRSEVKEIHSSILAHTKGQMIELNRLVVAYLKGEEK